MASSFREIPILLRGEIRPIQQWVEEQNTRQVLLYSLYETVFEAVRHLIKH